MGRRRGIWRDKRTCSVPKCDLFCDVMSSFWKRLTDQLELDYYGFFLGILTEGG